VTLLVTGGSGLVGTHVLEALRGRGEPVRVIVRAKSRAIVERFGAEPIVGDVTDPGVWREAAAGVRGIVHAAALVATRAPYAEFERVNVGGTRLAIEAARGTGARLVHVSSVAVYGRASAYRAGSGAVGEDFPFQPLSPHDYYARTKRMADDLVRSDAARGGLTAVAIRPNVIYGERDRLFTAKVITVIRRRVMPRIGSGTNHLSCVYAGNVASAIVAALDARVGPAFYAYNVTRDAPSLLTQREFLAAFAAALGVRVLFVPLPVVVARVGAAIWGPMLRLARPSRYSGLAGAAVWFIVGDNPYASERIRRDLHWTPPFDARTAIERAVSYWRAQPY